MDRGIYCSAVTQPIARANYTALQSYRNENANQKTLINQLVGQGQKKGDGRKFTTSAFCYAPDADPVENPVPCSEVLAPTRGERPKQERRQSNSQDYRELLGAAGKTGQQQLP